MFRSILFPFDGSERCMNAIPWVAGLARWFDSEVTVLYVNGGHAPSCVNLARARIALMDDLGDEWCLRPPATRVLEGRTEVEIVRFAETNGVDLIAMPTRGLGPLRRWFGRSVTQAVLESSPCAVWTSARLFPSRVTIDAVLCYPGISRDGIHSVRTAAAIAQLFGAALTLVHALPNVTEASLTDPPGAMRLLSISEAESYLRDLAAQARTNATVACEMGAPASVLKRMAFRSPGAIAVLPPGLTGAYDIVQSLPCSVFTGSLVPTSVSSAR